MAPAQEGSSLGDHLRALRSTARGSLADMAVATRISERYLRALESDVPDDLPAPVFVKGFIRAYCAFLGAPADDEIANAERYLSDSFPLRIDTPGRIASYVADLRVYGLPDDYWDRYRSAIGAVTAEEAVQTAHMYIKPESAAVVIVGEASRFEEALRAYGRVTVLSAEGATLRTLERSRPE